MAPLTVLISGASRGLGRGFVKRYVAQAGNTVIAGVRDLENPNSKALHELPKGEGSRLLIVKLDSDVESDPAQAVQTLAKEGIDLLDLVVANAGISNVYPSVTDVTPADLQQHIVTNVWGVLFLYQATLPMLLKSSNPKWMTVGSQAGSIEVNASNPRWTQPPIPNAAYGPSKTLIHWYTKRMNAEQEALTAFVGDPDFVDTDMGHRAANLMGMERAPVDPDDALDGLVKVVDDATKATHGGFFYNYKGKKQPW